MMAIKIAAKNGWLAPGSLCRAEAEADYVVPESAVLRSLMPEKPRYSRPGRPSSGKTRVTMLLKPETVEKFKAAGKGWQSRMSDILDQNAP